MKNFFVTTSIPYVNGEPHLGHGLEFVVGDVIARKARIDGQNVIFSTGTDEHGGKIHDKAKSLNITPQQLADQMSDKFKKLADSLNVSYDFFVRTTSDEHQKIAQQIWKKLEKDIYKSKYKGWYCSGCESFYNDEEVKANNGVCPNHDIKYELLEEENYFFRLSNYQDQILQVY
jgi:methionyl-tRNA synthetase